MVGTVKMWCGDDDISYRSCPDVYAGELEIKNGCCFFYVGSKDKPKELKEINYVTSVEVKKDEIVVIGFERLNDVDWRSVSWNFSPTKE